MSESFVGDRLRLARLMRGMTLQEVGAAVSVTRQNIHQLESGARMPGDDVLLALCECLGVSESFFYSKVDNDVKFEQCHFRKRKTTPVGVANRVLAYGTLFEQLVVLLNEHLELPSADFCIPQALDPDSYPLTPNKVESIAEECRKHWGLGTDSPIDNMIRVLESAGAVVTCFGGVSDKVDALSVNRKFPIVVRNTAKESPCRLRFDMAHECGHLVMHNGIETGDTRTEKEADAFASAFLMPRAAFAREFSVSCLRAGRLNWPKIYDLKLRWKVSVRAIIYRAHYLGLISAQQYRSANVHLNKSGQTKTEDKDSLIPMEQPEILQGAFSLLRSELGISFHMVAEKLGISAETLSLLTGIEVPVVEHRNVVPLRF